MASTRTDWEGQMPVKIFSRYDIMSVDYMDDEVNEWIAKERAEIRGISTAVFVDDERPTEGN